MLRTPSRHAPKLELKEPTFIRLQLKTVTPLFGGSAVAGKVDNYYPVRSASVRGHLRFWWRATEGAKYQSCQQLFDAESALWGSTERAGSVRVEVKTLDVGQLVQLSSRGADSHYPAYAIFPFTQAPGSQGRLGVRFELTLTCPPELSSQVEAALNAWIFFGGIGARTRRGCGSLERLNAQGSLPQGPTAPKGAPSLTTLPQSYFVGSPSKDAIWAWKEAVDLYKDFRQGEGTARNIGKERSRPGRSRYPEPDTLRQICQDQGQYCDDHEIISEIRGFPRANLGLPIVFAFKASNSAKKSPKILQGKVSGHQRFASPVITKAVKIDGEWRPVLALLNSPNVWEGSTIEVKGLYNVKPEEINLPLEVLREIKPLHGLPIREALLEFAKQEGFEERQL